VAEQRVAAGEVYLWCDPEPRSMAGSARPTAHGVAVNAVYTPREWRGRGYATACVAEISRRMLASGFDFCVLYTDLANPTSNAIYTRIGYRPVRDFLMYDLRIDASRL
jgi:predicted GNAT family acetyltransferase